MTPKIYVYICVIFAAVFIPFILGKYVFYREVKSVIIFDPSPIPFELDNCKLEGSNDAEITLIEFSDLECQYSLKTHNRIKKLLAIKKYKDSIKYYFKFFPLEQHKNDKILSKAIIAAGLQGKFKEMREAIILGLYLGISINVGISIQLIRITI